MPCKRKQGDETKKPKVIFCTGYVTYAYHYMIHFCIIMATTWNIRSRPILYYNSFTVTEPLIEQPQHSGADLVGGGGGGGGFWLRNENEAI